MLYRLEIIRVTWVRSIKARRISVSRKWKAVRAVHTGGICNT